MGVEVAAGITVGITVGITEGVGVAARLGTDVGSSAVGWNGVDRTEPGAVVGAGCSGCVPAGAASPPHAAVNTTAAINIDAATGSNLAGKVRTRIPTLP